MSARPPSGESGATLIVGAGLIGASIGMALVAAGRSVWLEDADPDVTRLAAALGAGTAAPLSPGQAGVAVDTVIVAVPPAAIATECSRLTHTYPTATVIHVCSVQTRPRLEIDRLMLNSSHIIGTHPMAGSERGGPTASSAALFRDRPWVICPDGCEPSAAAVADDVVRACGGYPVRMSATAHDDAVALVSHTPQLVSSALAGQLADAAPEIVTIAGTGIRDLTRLAGADPVLWRDIIASNAGPVRRHLRDLRDALDRVILALGESGPGDHENAAVTRLLDRGRAGRERLGGKHGSRGRHWSTVQVVIEDRPGTLVAVLSACQDLGVNVEDISVDHAPGHPVGVLELQVDPVAADSLAEALRSRGWEVAGVAFPHD